MANKLFDNAKKNKADEFYTQLGDIELELKNYKEYFKDKTVLCNCDDPYESNFFKYFAMNFEVLGLKKLIATCYDPSPIAGKEIDLFNWKESENFTSKAYKIEITETPDLNKDGAVDLGDVATLLKSDKNVLTKLSGNGDFRSDECIELLKEADIVVTNPPFSLFREYVAQLIEYNKKFIIIGNQNAITYKEIFPLIKDNKMWLGVSMNGSNRYFRVPEDYPLTEKTGKIENDTKYAFVKSVVWFTNLDTKRRNMEITLFNPYLPAKYPKYDNFDAINVDKVTDIPYDYYGYIGVPITFLHKYNPDQFEIVALGIVGSIDFSCEKKMEILKDGQPTGRYTINAKGTLYKKWRAKYDTKPPAFRDCETGELYQSIYARIIIKQKGEAPWRLDYIK